MGVRARHSRAAQSSIKKAESTVNRALGLTRKSTHGCRILRKRRESSGGRRHDRSASRPNFLQNTASPSFPKNPTNGSTRKGRMTHPMFLREGATHYEPISWEDAFRILADELNSLASPDEAVFYTSGRTSNEAAFLVSAFRPSIRHEQSARLLEYVSRIDERRARANQSDSAKRAFGWKIWKTRI